MRPRFSTTLVTAALLLALGGCSGAAGSGDSSEIMTTSATVTTSSTITASATVTVDTNTYSVTAGAGAAFAGDAVTGGTLSATLSAGQALEIRVEAPPGARVQVEKQLDGSRAILVDGVFAGGLGAPAGGITSGGIESSEATAGNALTIRFWPRDAAGATAGRVRVTIPVGRDAAKSARWGEAEGGRSLAVTPTAWGRAGGMTVMAYGWPSVVALAPDVDTGADPAANTGTSADADADAEGIRDSMRKQFRCHALGAPDKATWNLEPWRPNVSFAEFVATRCNPS